MTERAWTLGYRPAYEQAVRIPGNGKAPGGIVFPNEKAAAGYSRAHELDYAPYEIELPNSYELDVTDDYPTAHRARHRWHRTDDDPNDPAVEFMEQCGVCTGQLGDRSGLAYEMLVIVAPFINPDTGEVV